jgi:hypothetical protein
MFGAISQQSIQEKPVQQLRRRNMRAGPRRPPNNPFHALLAMKAQSNLNDAALAGSLVKDRLK